MIWHRDGYELKFLPTNYVIAVWISVDLRAKHEGYTLHRGGGSLNYFINHCKKTHDVTTFLNLQTI